MKINLRALAKAVVKKAQQKLIEKLSETVDVPSEELLADLTEIKSDIEKLEQEIKGSSK